MGSCALGLDGTEDEQIEEWRLLIGGDGRYLNREVIQLFVEMLYACFVDKLGDETKKPMRIFIAQNGTMSTPACSNFIRENACNLGGFILTASHNMAGPNGDWGIKYNNQHGSPATERITDRIYEFTQSIQTYTDMNGEFPQIDIGKIGITTYGENSDFIVEIVDPVSHWMQLMREVFDFVMISDFLQLHRKRFAFIFDCMHAVSGVYARKLFVDELGMTPEQLTLCNEQALEDFGGMHPDPNLVYAKNLVDKMFDSNSRYSMGAASDGDGDRNMILGNQFFVTPSDSLSIIVDYADKCIPLFKHGLKGVARSMPTSTSVDRVAQAKNIALYEVPTGWKYFGNLMDSGKLSICGEESFGTGSDHIREKDGLFAVLAWLSIIAYENRNTTPNDDIVGVKEIVQKHWKQYGRSFYCRYDYEEVDSTAAEKMMEHLRTLVEGRIAQAHPKYNFGSCEEFKYVDQNDGSEADKQGIIIRFTDGSRIVFRLSGTGSSGATIRCYIEKYVQYSIDAHNTVMNDKSQEVIKGLADIALELSRLAELTQREKPSVIT